MAAPRPYRLELEAFEERTLPSGGFGGDNPSGSREWDATPARARDLDPRAGPAPGEGRGTNAGRVQTFAAPQSLALAVVVDRPAVATAREVGFVANPAQQAAVVVSTAQPGSTGAIQMPPNVGRPVTPDAGVVPPAVRSDRSPGAAPPGGANTERAPAPMLLMFSGSNEQMTFSNAGPVESVVPFAEPSVAPPPRPAVPPLDGWLPVEIDIPVAVPLAGLLRANAAGIEAGAQRLLELTTGIEVEGDGGGWWLWLAAGAALAGGAGYAAWTNRRPLRAMQGGSDDARIG